MTKNLNCVFKTFLGKQEMVYDRPEISLYSTLDLHTQVACKDL